MIHFRKKFLQILKNAKINFFFNFSAFAIYNFNWVIIMTHLLFSLWFLASDFFEISLFMINQLKTQELLDLKSRIYFSCSGLFKIDWDEIPFWFTYYAMLLMHRKNFYFSPKKDSFAQIPVKFHSVTMSRFLIFERFSSGNFWRTFVGFWNQRNGRLQTLFLKTKNFRNV